jgi:2,5-diketo-D-gluconate reductase A
MQRLPDPVGATRKAQHTTKDRKETPMTPTINLNDGTTIPQLGFGTLNVPPDRSASEANTKVTADVVRHAIEIGYRHFDTAQMYGNEAGVGLGVRNSKIAREQIHLTSKLSNANHRPDDVRRSFDLTLTKLGVDQLDLFLIHWPVPMHYDGDYVATWRATAELKSDGRLRSAGVSNFTPAHLDRIIDETGIVPVINQIEVHPYFRNDAARQSSIDHGIAIEAWSPLGQGAVLEDPIIARIAAALDKTPAQIILRWHIQHGHIVFPKSMHTERMKENISIFDFDLTPHDMVAIDALDRGEEGRIGPNPEVFDWVPA